MFSEQLKKQLKKLDINTEENSTFIRISLEDALDESAEFLNTEHHHKYQVVERAYSDFMEEYTNMLDAGGALFN